MVSDAVLRAIAGLPAGRVVARGRRDVGQSVDELRGLAHQGGESVHVAVSLSMLP